MDMIILDLRSQPTAKVGDSVQLWGSDLPVDDVARHAGTIAYEVTVELLMGTASEREAQRCQRALRRYEGLGRGDLVRSV